MPTEEAREIEQDRRHERLRLTFTYLVLSGGFLLGSIMAIGLFYFVATIETERQRFMNYIFAQPAAVFGVPCAAAAAMFVVLLLRTTQGPIEFEVIGVRFRGASGPIVMWVLTFLSVIAAIKLLWLS